MSLPAAGAYCSSLAVFEHGELQNLACARCRRSRTAAAARGTAGGSAGSAASSRPPARPGSGPGPGRGGGSGRRLIGRSAGPRGRCRGRRRGRRGGGPQNGRQSRLLRGGCGRRRGREAAEARRARARSRSILPPVDGAARDPGGLLSLPRPSAMKHRGAGAIRSGKVTAAGAGQKGPGGTRCSPGLSLGRGAKEAAALPVLSFPGYVPLAVPDPRVPVFPRRCSRRAGRGESPGFPARSRRSAEAPDQWLRVSRGSCRGQHRGQPALGLPARPSATEECSRHLLSPTSRKTPPPPAVHLARSRPAQPSGWVQAWPRAAAPLGRLGSAGSRQGSWCPGERRAPGAAPAARRGRTGGLC